MRNPVTLSIQAITTGKWRENCYVVHQANRQAVIIDPGDEAETINHYINSQALKVLAVLNTHAHYDHLGAVAAIKKTYAVPFYLHSQDQKILKYAKVYHRLFGDGGLISLPSVDHYLDEVKLPLRLNSFSVQVLHTPGHTPGGVCFFIEDHLFTGDTLFKGKVGRVDLPGGDKKALSSSLKKLKLLPPQTTIYPGHGRPSTILEEMQKNAEFLKAIQ